MHPVHIAANPATPKVRCRAGSCLLLIDQQSNKGAISEELSSQTPQSGVHYLRKISHLGSAGPVGSKYIMENIIALLYIKFTIKL